MTEVKLVAWKGSDWLLPAAIIWLLLRAVVICSRERIDIVHFGDGLLAPLAFLFKKMFKVRTSVTAHGLDVAYGSKSYQSLMKAALANMDKVFAVSRHTLELCRERGVAGEKLACISNGIQYEEFRRDAGEEEKRRLLTKIGIERRNAKLILTVGRLIRRKGVLWFVENVLGKIAESDASVVYIVVGRGPDNKLIRKAIMEKRLERHTAVVPCLSDDEIKVLYQCARVFIMPNMQVAGDAEGFGIVALEAAASGCPVVASGIEGIRDAISDGKNGFLVKERSADEFAAKINALLQDERFRSESAERFSHYTRTHYDWSGIAQSYMREFGEILSS